ncbi:hypothetical protein NDU88_005734 [Pleurodeles waltl]|uniref:Uncharacterized protein n=1 Tax=Pleurodeles waltl TaxID=8319 RepID=A0AAV7WZ50_PLEWA|nr:hypothetical protein NDU88_005734 [Pleurodeles waltl]
MDLPQFVQDLPVTGLSAGEKASLEVDITVEELRGALAQLNTGKAPGSNGFPPEYWYLVWQQAGQPMLEMFQEALKMGKLPPDLHTADVVVLPKPETDRASCFLTLAEQSTVCYDGKNGLSNIVV